MFFRKDINGLRAIAVVAVVLFHFNIVYFKGGFAGVDIFFVISGYLMTSIIFNKLQKDRFSILEFYLARAKRIVPALLVLCIILLCITWFILPPYEFKNVGKQLVSAATFTSNFLFLKEAGYFDTSSHEKWLLHTWSLSVEWQFYIIFPVALVLIKKLSKLSYTPWIILFCATGSFLLSAFFPAKYADAGFYLLPTRAWEMMSGGLVYLFALQVSHKKSAVLESIGFLIIVSCILFLDATVKWPGSLALIPVLGTVLILVAAQENSFITGNKVAQYLGSTSYSLYLWHWPVVVGLHLFGIYDTPQWALAGIIVSLVCAHLSYTFVEQYGRSQANHTNNYFQLGKYAAMSSIIICAGLIIFRFDGLPFRVDEFVAVADKEQKNRNPRTECFVVPNNDPKSPMCVFGENKSKIAVIVIGDSHSNATITAVAAAIPEQQGGALFLGADGCISMMDISTHYFDKCGAYNKKILSYLDENLNGVPVILINHITEKLLTPEAKTPNTTVYLNGIANTEQRFPSLFTEQYTNHICDISKKHPVFIMQPIPDMGINVPQAITRAKMYEAREIDVSVIRDDYDSHNFKARDLNGIAAKTCNASVIDPREYLCDTTTCFGSINKRPLYYDDDHLSEFGNKLLVPMFSKVWNQQVAVFIK